MRVWRMCLLQMSTQPVGHPRNWLFCAQEGDMKGIMRKCHFCEPRAIGANFRSACRLRWEDIVRALTACGSYLRGPSWSELKTLTSPNSFIPRQSALQFQYRHSKSAWGVSGG